MRKANGANQLNVTEEYENTFKMLIRTNTYHQLNIDEAIRFEKELAEQRRNKALRKLDQNFANKPEHMKRWIEEANKHEQIALLLERLKIMESTKKWQEEKY